MAEKIPRPPRGTGRNGRRLWSSITREFDLGEWELALLRSAVQILDTLDDLDAAVEAEGAMVPGPGLSMRVHPAIVEGRQLRIALSRVLAALRVPSGDEDAGRPQRRVGPRGTYGVGGGPARLRSVS